MATKRQPLTKEAIITAALELVDAGGMEALSMRALGARLGVQAMSLYNHVANKEAVLDGLHERLILQLELDAQAPDWVSALRSAARSYRGLARQHPQAFVLLATRPLATPEEVVRVAPVFELIGAAGYGITQRVLLVQTFFTALNGILLAEVAPVPGHSDAAEPDSAAVFRAVADQHLDHDGGLGEIARLAETEFGDIALATVFDQMVELVLTGLASLVPDPGN
jgi:TetR/AcrR family transcriptional regulator, tetracycline repressor protein